MIYKPKEGEAPAYYNYYVGLCKEDDLAEALHTSLDETLRLLSCIPAEKEDFRYAEGKWTLKEVLAHIIDAERIFAYRALRFSHKDKTELPGFDENGFAPNGNSANRKLQDIAREYKVVRESSIALFEYMDEDMLDFKGTANKIQVSSRALGWMICGHNLHHCKVIKEKYLI